MIYLLIKKNFLSSDDIRNGTTLNCADLSFALIAFKWHVFAFNSQTRDRNGMI